MCLCAAVWLGATAQGRAESLTEALATAYTANPELGAGRAELRGIDEGVPQALSGLRPTVTARGDWGATRSTAFSKSISPLTGATVFSDTETFTAPRGYSVEVGQTLFDGFRTFTRTQQAEANVWAGRESLANTEQNVLLDAVTAYVDVVRDVALVRLQEGNLDVLSEELESTEARFDVGELTRTDVAQSEARMSRAMSDLAQARADLATSRAVYRRTVGRAPGSLRQPGSIDALLPRSREEALIQAETEHPALRSAHFTVEAADHEIETIKGELLPTVTVEGDVTHRWESSDSVLRSDSASIIGRLTVPLYQAGSVSSRVRQARQRSTQRRLEAEDIRAQITASVSSAWDGLAAARAQIVADRQQVRAGSVVLEGVREEQRVGQRTTLDVLNSQQELLNAQVSLAVTQRNEVVAAYTLLAAVGRLNARVLGLPVAYYDPTEHYGKVRNKWWGLSDDGPH